MKTISLYFSLVLGLAAQTTTIPILTPSGLDPTGTNSNNTAMGAALTANAGPVTFYLPCGTYKFTSILKLTRSQQIQGNGTCTILSFATYASGGGAAVAIGDTSGGTNLYQLTNLSNLAIVGPGYAITGTIGIALGGDPAGVFCATSCYADQVNLSSVRVSQFYESVQFGNNTYVNGIDKLVSFNNHDGIYYPSGLSNSGEREVVTNSTIFNNGNVGLQLPGGGEWLVVGTSLDYNNGEAVNFEGGHITLYSDHIEENTAPLVTMASGSGTFTMRDSDLLVQQTSGSATDIFDFFPSPTLQVVLDNLNVFSNQTTPLALMRFQGTTIGSVHDIVANSGVNALGNVTYSNANFKTWNTNWETERVNGAVVPASAALLATNSGRQYTPVTIGAGLSISSGTLSASGSSGGTSVLTSPTYYAYGDSITAGAYATVTAADYAQTLARYWNTQLTNFASSGNTTCDVSNGATTLVIPYYNSPIQTLMVGVNDANNESSVSTYPTLGTTPCFYAAASWLTIPDTNKVHGQTCTQTGTWSNFGSFGVYNGTNGSTLTCNVVSYGGPIYVYYHADNTWGTGSASVSVDGGTAQTISSNPITLGGNLGYGSMALRFPSIAAGTHTVLVTVTSATGSNYVGVIAVGTVPPPVTNNVGPFINQPSLFAAGVMKQQGDALSSTTAQYNTLVQTNVTTLAGDGLPIKFVNVRNGICTTITGGNCYGPTGVADYANLLHPNNQGYLELANFFAAAMNVTPNAQPVTSTVANLPACLSYYNGVTYIATDITTLTFGASPTGGGSISGPVTCSNTSATASVNWTIH